MEDVELGPLAADDLLVSVRLAALSFGDVLIATGKYQVRPPLPFTPGSEGIGTVEAVGSSVTDLAPGDEVLFYGFRDGTRNERSIIGTFAEKVVVPRGNAIPRPVSMNDHDAVLFRTSYETSLYGLQRGQLVAGETLLVLGAGGATGAAAVGLGKALGAQVIASASSPAKREIALKAGADHVVDSRDAHWREQIDTLTEKRGVDVIYDPVGGDETERAFRALGWGGRHVVIGFAAGRIPSLPVHLALHKGASLVGANLLRFNDQSPAEAAVNIQTLIDMHARGLLHMPPIAAEFGLKDIAAAMDSVSSGRTSGRVVINPRLGGRP